MNWYDFNEREKKESYYINLSHFVDDEYSKGVCFPPRDKILNALNLTPYDATKVVILGQDPYHGENQAMGLSFSVPRRFRHHYVIFIKNCMTNMVTVSRFLNRVT